MKQFQMIEMWGHVTLFIHMNPITTLFGWDTCGILIWSGWTKSKITYSISSSFQETSGILGSAHERKKTASMNNSSHEQNKIREYYSFL